MVAMPTEQAAQRELRAVRGAGEGHWLDRLGIAISTLCLLQCLALPVLLVAAPMLSAGLLSHEAFHLVLLAVIVPVSGLAFGLGFHRHRDSRVWWPAGAGIALLVAAAWLEHQKLWPPLAIAAVTSMGGVCLIIAHWINLRPRRRA